MAAARCVRLREHEGQRVKLAYVLELISHSYRSSRRDWGRRGVQRRSVTHNAADDRISALRSLQRGSGPRSASNAAEKHSARKRLPARTRVRRGIGGGGPCGCASLVAGFWGSLDRGEPAHARSSWYRNRDRCSADRGAGRCPEQSSPSRGRKIARAAQVPGTGGSSAS